ncbi:MAG TPA: Crp/Fnr family transcriptional regulator [Flavobacterium sp.]|jgi:CRP-like cAMP-binding protein|uniref:Crp/Fnr family transcriptional regulator n=1 Tax=Flavobacterium sp. TaxID=239 RepID=UPI001B74971A|nr:Crp/Fnr family transcriptional regulator [Flavobacterium sp.]MBP6147369.1 Crp/Fnr family transcriptional regulator [Flavobacterium sp.]MBP7183661.1 Crp/Fnr family transcriptional regulator [Flavobacterium sp.]MBP7317486.1 Crp/Fnr family transcriptional regulator [Flavobacterium sp.]MBP8886794.1 Crp/Fnr family transcriptional regulator [Flavobacterium sp.]HRM12775.1 Crp/Fnr family transcriptional regulator [Flavobacterium sp.]
MSKCEQCIVREFSSLKTLTKEELLTLSDCKTSHIIKKGDAIFEEGENVNGIYCIKEGVCKLTKLSANGKDHIVKLVTRGELLGQRSMISDEPVNLSAIALEDMQVCFIPKTEVMGYFDKNNQFSLSVMKSICGDLKDADDHLVNLAQKTVKERLAETLLYLHDTFGKKEDNSLKVVLSRDELASMIGTATESCIRLLSDFNKLGLIELNGKKIVLKDINALKKLAD